MTEFLEILESHRTPPVLWLEGVADEVLGASASPSGSGPSDQAQFHGPDATRFDPSRTGGA